PVRADPELLRRCLSPQRTEEDWCRFKERYEGAIRNIAARALCQLGFGTCRDAVDELVQEVYLRWLRSDSGFDGAGAGAFWNFIRASVRHAMHDRRRFLAAEKRRPRAGAVHSVNSQKPPGPHEAYVRDEARRTFLDHCLAIGEMSSAGGLRSGVGEGDGSVGSTDDGRRRALALGGVVLGGCTTREAATFLGVGVSAVDSMLRRLRRRLAAHGVEMPPHRSIRAMGAAWSAAWAGG
ncbi:MAG: sigma factor, partial [Acidobacteriota bacterium]